MKARRKMFWTVRSIGVGGIDSPGSGNYFKIGEHAT